MHCTRGAIEKKELIKTKQDRKRKKTKEKKEKEGKRRKGRKNLPSCRDFE
jgi:hypothetical protein